MTQEVLQGTLSANAADHALPDVHRISDILEDGSHSGRNAISCTGFDEVSELQDDETNA